MTVIGGAEGLRQSAYPDPATRGNPWTICYGHTGGVKPGERASMEECKALLIADMDKEGDAIEKCVPSLATAPVERYVASLSLSHNIGSGGFCRSSVHQTSTPAASARPATPSSATTRAAGFVMPGLTARRKKERELCMVDLPQ